MYKLKLSTRFSALLFLAVVAGAVSGCGDGRPARVKVSGYITVEGQPLKFGGVSFKPVDGGRAAGGGVNSDGQYLTTMYKLNDGLPPGSYMVAVNAVENINYKSQRWHAPKSYSEHATAGLSVEITEETTDLNFELTWEVDEKHSAAWVEKL